MKFEISEKIITSRSPEDILICLENQFRKVSKGINRSGMVIEAKSIEASFGSINRTDITNIYLKKSNDGYLLIADVVYKPSIAFWIIFIITLFTWVFWLVPVAFYLLQKDTVKTSIHGCFQRVKNEFDQTISNTYSNSITNNLAEEIEKLGLLKDKGLITEDEFSNAKKRIFGFQNNH